MPVGRPGHALPAGRSWFEEAPRTIDVDRWPAGVRELAEVMVTPNPILDGPASRGVGPHLTAPHAPCSTT
jgi:hypothetical protein